MLALFVCGKPSAPVCTLRHLSKRERQGFLASPLGEAVERSETDEGLYLIASVT